MGRAAVEVVVGGLVSAAPKLAKPGAAASAACVAGERPSERGTASAEPVGRPRACSMGSAEVEQCRELLAALGREGVGVRARAGVLVVTGTPRDMFGRCALETLEGREPAVEKALALAEETAPDFAKMRAAPRLTAGERKQKHAAVLERRRERRRLRTCTRAVSVAGGAP